MISNTKIKKEVEIASFKNIAVVGVSDKKFGGVIYKTLKKRNINVYPVNPNKDTFEGDKCYLTVKDLPESINTVVIAVSDDTAVNIIDQLKDTNIKNIWFQQGNKYLEAIQKAESFGLNFVSGKCILMYAEPVTGIHKFHKILAELFSKK